MRIRRRVVGVVLSGCVVMVLAVGGSAAAAGGPVVGQIDSVDPALPGSVSIGSHVSSIVPEDAQATSDLGTRLSLVADQVRTMADPASFSGLTVDERSATITVFDVGDPSSGIRAYAASAPLGMTINLMPTGRFTRAQAMAASEKLIESKQWVAALGVTMTSVNPDGSGLTVFVSGDAPTSDVQSQVEQYLALPGGITLSPKASPIIDQ
jgi:hypothetical protein